MAGCRGSSSRWFFTREQLESTPSRRCGVEPDRELSYRQQAANLIQDMGQRLNVSQLTINTAIVYMHRFYMYHSFTKFHRNIISPTTLFLAAKVEEQPRKLEHVIKVAHACLNPQEPPLDIKSNAYLQQAQELVILETIVLQTLGFEVTIDHPHTDVVKCSQLVRASKDLAQTSYFMATNSLHLTTFCLQYRPTVIACVCIHLACKWSNWEIPVSTDGKHWWEYVDSSVTLELLDELTHEFLQILEKTPSRLKRIRNWRATQAAKKPKSEIQVNDGSLPGPSSVPPSAQQPSLVDSMPGISTSTAFPKASVTFPAPLASTSGGALSLDSLEGIPGTPYTFTAPTDWPQEPPIPNEVPGLQPPHSVSQTLHPQSAQRMTLDKYREKHAAELANQRRRQDVGLEAPAALPSSEHHRKQLHPHQGPSNASETSPLKTKLPATGPDHHMVDKRDKSGLKVRLPIPLTDKSDAGREELKMKIKVSSERHSSSDEGGARNKLSSPLVSKEKHRDHPTHRHHKHAHLHPHSGNGRGALEGVLRSPVGVSAEGSGSGSSRKRLHPEVHCVSSDDSVLNLPFPPPPPVAYQVGYGQLSTPVKLDRSPVGSHGPEGSAPGHAHNPAPQANGQHMDYKDTFNMLNSLLSAQGMNL
uniref:Cyclin T2 n=1 Tax=Scleropages formosus TaxID=113540 RepID=A0A8D0CHX6_SCLFO